MPGEMVWFIATTLLIVALLTTGVALAAGTYERDRNGAEPCRDGDHRAGSEREPAHSQSTSGQEQHAA